MDMAWTDTHDRAAFESAAGEFLYADPVSNTTALTLLADLRERGDHAFGTEPPRFGVLADADGTVASAFAHTPPFPLLLLGALPLPQVASFVDVLLGGPRPVTWMIAGDDTAAAVAAAWHDRTGTVATVAERQRLYRLDALVPPDPMPEGAARPAGPGDREVLMRMLTDFEVSLGHLNVDPARLAAANDLRIAHGLFTVWETAGEVVSVAANKPLAAGVARVGPVYTPPEHRGRGYGGAVTAARTADAFAQGADEVVLFTDLANPTSNSIYQRIGYVPLEDRVMLAFPAPDGEVVPV
ncbi:GNAT family N-acetyltransferase [Yinghuangia seranimata]|uniref:GNAT family N-acetyltransferase n=1 Tax=Yinghuangia seranimata TaxID=408067 RepID=UPI00248AAA1A|nr:GNAT family N-acetyltransferase [Yinghuangia seranimata]MDI2127908.1 GNAT family N-acetyltransferase [Yinghuangia seranimata]